MTSKFDFLIDLNKRLNECRKWGFSPTTVFYPSNIIPSGVSYAMNVSIKEFNIYDKSGNLVEFAFSEVKNGR